MDLWCQPFVGAFRISLLGSQWTQEKKGRIYDGFMGSAKTQDAQGWCDQYGLAHSARFDPEHYGGDQNSRDLAVYWCHLREHLYQLWLVSGSGDYTYTTADLEEFKPRHNLDDLLEKCKKSYRGRAKRVCSKLP